MAFGKKTDKNGDYIKKYVPILRKFPSKYIYEPWTAPLEVRMCSTYIHTCMLRQDYERVDVFCVALLRGQQTTSKKKTVADVCTSHTLQVQRGCGCIIGKDYPRPIVDHADVSKDNMAKMHDAYDANKEAEGAGSQRGGSGSGSGSGGSSGSSSTSQREQAASNKRARR